ncbi:hypothetical protein D3C85_1073580 [compost metagenome]
MVMRLLYWAVETLMLAPSFCSSSLSSASVSRTVPCPSMAAVRLASPSSPLPSALMPPGRAIMMETAGISSLWVPMISMPLSSLPCQVVGTLTLTASLALGSTLRSKLSLTGRSASGSPCWL